LACFYVQTIGDIAARQKSPYIFSSLGTPLIANAVEPAECLLFAPLFWPMESSYGIPHVLFSAFVEMYPLIFQRYALFVSGFLMEVSSGNIMKYPQYGLDFSASQRNLGSSSAKCPPVLWAMEIRKPRPGGSHDFFAVRMVSACRGGARGTSQKDKHWINMW